MSFLKHSFPQLQEVDLYAPQTAQLLRSLLQEQQNKDKTSRLHRWSAKMETDDKAFTTYVKEADAALHSEQASQDGAAAAPTTAEPVHPQQRVEDSRSQLEQLWNPATLPENASLDQFLDWVSDGGFPATEVRLSGKALLRLAKKTARKAGSVDHWLPADFAFLPEEFFNELAALRCWITEAVETCEVRPCSKT
jgi:hypothetical protein